MRHDAAIVGAGIAGAAALLALRGRGLRLAVIAPESEPGFKIGETLSPVANEELRELGVGGELAREGHFKAFGRFSAWGSDRLEEQSTWEGRREAGWYLDRARFEEWLWRHAGGVTFDRIVERVSSARDAGDHWRIQCSGGAAVEARYVLDCSGRSGVVGRQMRPRKRLDKLVASYALLQQYREEVEPTVGSLVEAAPGGWAYSALVPGDRLVVSWFTDSDLLPEGITSDPDVWAGVLRNAKFTWKRIETAEFELEGLPQTVDASTLLTTEFATSRFLAAGDAAACFDPLSSHGITTALWSGRKAAAALRDLLDGSEAALDAYRTAFQAGIDRYLRDKQRIYSTEPRFAEHPFWSRRRHSPR